jgi:uncharacterized protein DUF885
MRELDRLAASYFDLLWHFDPAAASAAGFVSADGRLGQFDAEAMRTHLAAFRAAASALEELELEELADEIDRTALLDEVRATIVRLDEDRPHVRDPGIWLIHLVDAFAALAVRPDDDAAADRRAQAAVERVAGIPAFLDSARRVIHRPPVVLVDGALVLLGSLGELLVHVATAFGHRVPGGLEALNLSVAAALQALAGFGHWLRVDVEPEPAITAVVLGVTRYERRLGLRYAVRSSSAELWRYATQLMTETETLLAAEAARLGPGRQWREVLTGLDQGIGDVVAAVRDEIERARVFLRERGFGDVPAAGPDVAGTPAPLTALLPRLTYLPDAARLLVIPRRAPRFAVPTLVAGATLPGRHLQEMAARATEGEVRRRLRTTIAVEGWALYAEELMEELRFGAAPETRLFRLARLLQAAAALAVDVGVHTRDMTPADAAALLADRAALDRPAAEAQVRHIVAHPTDASAAAVGRREILALRAAASVRVDDAAGFARFHRALLGFGALPPGLAGWGMGIER